VETDKNKANLGVAKDILKQQVHMATTRDRKGANRIVPFHWPDVRSSVRAKEGETVEFGPKAHADVVDGVVCLDPAQYDPVYEGFN
jgi:hypothetical protein